MIGDKDHIADLEIKVAERQNPQSDLSAWFCPAKGDLGCAGPVCPLFYIKDGKLRCDY